MKKAGIIDGRALAIMAIALSMPVLAEEGASREIRLAQVAASQDGPRYVVGTLAQTDVESREAKARKYRSCLFTYLPRVGSDVAAEILRDACKAEYMPPP